MNAMLNVAPTVRRVIGRLTWCKCVEVIRAGDWCPTCGVVVVDPQHRCESEWCDKHAEVHCRICCGERI